MRMRKGINIWSFPSRWTIEECISVTKKADFEGIELVLNETGAMSLESSQDEITGYRRSAEKAGIEISGLATGLFWRYSLTSNREDIRRKAMDIVRKQIDVASWLGADTILVVPGVVGCDFKPDMVVPDLGHDGFYSGSEIVEYDAAYDRSLSAIKELIPYAAKKKVVIGIENVWNKFLLSPLEMRDFVDKAASEYLGVYFDVGNVVYTGYPEQWIRILGKRIKKLHLKDYRREAGNLSGFVDLLAGDVDYVRVVERLREIGYDGFLNAEMTPAYRDYPEQILYNTSKAMDRILGRNQAPGV